MELITMDTFKNYQFIVDMAIHTKTCHLWKFSNMCLNTTLGIVLTLYHTYKFR